MCKRAVLEGGSQVIIIEGAADTYIMMYTGPERRSGELRNSCKKTIRIPCCFHGYERLLQARNHASLSSRAHCRVCASLNRRQPSLGLPPPSVMHPIKPKVVPTEPKMDQASVLVQRSRVVCMTSYSKVTFSWDHRFALSPLAPLLFQHPASPTDITFPQQNNT